MLTLNQIQEQINENSHVVENSSELIEIVRAAAHAGICPECGSQLVLNNVKGYLFSPRGHEARVDCPNGHNINYNTRTGTEPQCFGYYDVNLHRLGNSMWADSQNYEIRTLAHRIGTWLAD